MSVKSVLSDFALKCNHTLQFRYQVGVFWVDQYNRNCRAQVVEFKAWSEEQAKQRWLAWAEKGGVSLDTDPETGVRFMKDGDTRMDVKVARSTDPRMWTAPDRVLWSRVHPFIWGFLWGSQITLTIGWMVWKFWLSY